MKLFDKFRKFIACAVLTAFIPSQAWAQGITIPASSALNLNTGQLTVPGGITIDTGGTLSTTTGPITLTGNWANSGTFHAGTGTVNFVATSGTQTLDSGGTAAADAFYNLTHNTAGKVQLNSNAIAVGNNFTNTSGTFDANNENINVAGNWDNTAAFTPGTNTVTLNGANGSTQDVLGTTAFYNFSKTVTGASTLVFDHTGTQTFNKSVTMQGASSQLLSIRSTTNGTQANIALTSGGAQSISYVDVQDSNASGGLGLVGRNSPDHSNFATYNNTNWTFGNTTLTWVGGTSTEWQNPVNWDKGLVPAAGDTVSIPGGTTYEPDLCPSGHSYPCAAVIIANLTIAASASLTLSGQNVTVSTGFSNSGNVNLEGIETLTLTMDSTHGTFTYVGAGGTSSATHTLTINGSTNVAFNNLTINDTNAHPDVFASNGTVTVNGNLTVTSGTLDISANTDTLTAGGTLSVNGANGTLTATNGNITANGAVSITAGVLTAPGSGKSFTIAGNFTHSGGTFTNSSGTVTLNGTGQIVSGSTTFYDFDKTVAAGSDTLEFDGSSSSNVQTFTDKLMLQGNAANKLLIRSTTASQAYIALSPGGAQVLNYLDVNESNASGGILLAPSNSTDSGSNTNWVFTGTTLTWKGAISTDWGSTPGAASMNWDLGFVPRTIDTVVVANAARQPVLSANVTVTNLTINSGSTLTLGGHNLSVSSAFSNSGNFVLEGNETLTLTMDSTHGTFTYVGAGGSSSVTHTLTINGSTNVAFNNLTINDTNSTPADRDVFATNGSLTVNGTLAVSSGTLNASNASSSIAADGNMTITTPGIFTAPGAGTFTVTGNWSNSGTFNNSNGLVTFNGGNQSISGTTTFYQFNKTVAATHSLTFDHLGTQTFTKSVTMQGAASNLLSILSDLSGTQANIALTSGGLQTINYVNVQDSNASGGLLLVGRNPSAGSSTQHNTNWSFGPTTITWTGTTSTDWDTPSNWNLGIVPIAGDTAIIANATNQPVLSSTVTVGALTINSGSTLALNGKNLTVDTSSGGTGILTNNGTIKLFGSETVNLTTVNTNAGTFEFDGDNTGGTYNIANKVTITNPSDDEYFNLKIDDTHASLDTFTIGAGALKVDGSLEVDGGTLDLSGSSSVTVTSNVIINSGGILKGPSATTAAAFSVGGNWTNNGTYNNSNGEINFDTSAATTITGNTTFYDLYSHTAGKVLRFTAGSNQTVSNVFDIAGLAGNLVSLVSTSTGNSWDITFPNGAQSVGELNVEDSSALTNTVTCLNCTNSGHNNSNWIFYSLSIDSPAIGTAVGQAPTLIGVAPASSNVYIRDISGNLVATTKSDANGKFRVVVGKDAANTGLTITAQMATGANSLTPYLTAALTAPGVVNNVTVTASPTTNQVPDITKLNSVTIANPNVTQFISGSTPIVAGHGLAGQNVTVQALDSSGNLLLSAGSGTVAGDGTYSVTLTTALPSATNYLSVTVGTSANETTSAIIEVSLTDPFGVVYNSTTNDPVQGAVVTLYNATTKQAVAGTLKSCNAAGTCCDMSGSCTDISGNTTTGNPPANPVTTGSDGFYSFLAPPGQYYINVSSAGYNYPSVQTTVPSGRSVGTGSKGEVFTVGSTVFQLDQPLDANSMLLRITKTANKSEGSVGDIVMYTVNIQNLSSTNTVTNVFINDEIPPGFKYIKDRVLLNGAPTGEPSGQRPLVFNIGTVAPGVTMVLQYQLVIGSGVTMGTYRNTATARYSSGLVISNPAEASVKIIPDPVFDLGSVIGKVFFDWNENGIQDPPYYDAVSHETIVEKPVPNVQIVMEDGTIITTDRDGKFNIPGLLPGRHIFRLDERTLPPGAYMTTDKAVIDDVTAGSISKVNFGVNIDESQTKGRDAVFFNEKIRLTQDSNRPVPRLNAALFDASANADPKTEEVLLYNGILVRQAEFRIFTNYSPFISSWHLDILDADTKKLIRSFEGTALNINDPVYWDGRDNQGTIINPDYKYSYVLSVTDKKGDTDDTKEKPITIRQIKDEDSLKKERDETKDVLKDRADRYRKWLDAQGAVNNLDHQLIPIQGETIHLDRQGTDVKSIQVMKGDRLFTDIPLSEQYGLTPQELVAGGFSAADEKDNLEIILPNGDYTLDVVSAKAANDSSSSNPPAAVPQSVPEGGMPSRTISSYPGTLERYSRPLKVGDDYLMFVALGDAQVGYNIDRGNIEPIQDATLEPGFYHQGKGAYYLKGQILGKYLITSSYDSDRAEKALFRQLDPNTYYPVYGDASSINYDAADTQGALYLKVEWDKSSAILGNFAIDFNNTQFANFSRDYYGGKIDYQSVSNTPYGDPRTKLVVYHAQVQQLPSHNEFLATGGSLYFLKYRNVIQGSDTVTIQVRDQTTGLVVASQTLTNGADYELDNSQGRILFWQPVAMIAQSESIISNSLVGGDPIYVVVDYQYAVSGMQTQGSQGIRVAQAIGDNVVLGGTYVQDNSSGQEYTLEGTDATLHLDKDSTIKAEYAQTTSQEQGSYVSTDGGITFSSLSLDNSVSGKAYGITGDTRLFNNIGLTTYYKWIGSDFGATSTSSQQGKEMMGMSLTFDMSPETRLTASEDIQRLLAGGNLQTSAQVGASETDTTMVQIVHDSQRLKLTGQFQLTQVKSVVNGIVSTTNQQGATIAGQAQYDLTDRVKLTLGQQVDVVNRDNNATTLGVAVRATDHTTLNGQEVFSSQGKALTAAVTNQIGKRIALTTGLTLTNLNTGEVDKTASVGVEDKVNKNIMATGTLALTGSSTGSTTTTASVGTKAKLSDTTSLDMSLGKSQTSTGTQSTTLALNGTTQVDQNTTLTAITQVSNGSTIADALGIGTTGVTTTSVGVQATSKIDENTTRNASVNIADDTTGGKSTTVAFGNNSKLDQELEAVTTNSFTFSPTNGTIDSSQYGLVRNQNGKKLEADYTRQLANQPSNISQSNIFGLTGDVNDQLALTGSIQRGKLQNLDTSMTDRTDIALAAGYVLKDTEKAEATLKNSIKLELRLDRGIGTDSLRQYVLYDALDGKITDNLSVNAKIDYSKTLDTTTGATAERHQEIILGMAYRPVNFDNLNFITEYSYEDGYGGGTQQADALNTDVQQTITQVFSAEGVYDINDKWQLAEKLALRIQNEQDTGFQFTQTHTWLMIHRLNYKIDPNWTISGELRDLTQVEAKDNKIGLLMEATHDINQNTELSIGWNFTSYNDDLTNLSYTAQGPFVRMTGKFYDRTPEEKARDRAKWLDARINEWAWALIKKELAKKDSKIVLELNRMFALAKIARAAGRLEESHQIYKDIISAGQIMYDEASEYIRHRIEFEEQLQKLDKTAREYFKGGEYVKARKIWEKVVEDASKGMVK